MGKSESKREHIQRSRDAQEAKNVSRCTEEDRCRAASPMGEGKGCERMIQEKKNIMPRPNRSGFFCPLTWEYPRTSLVISIPTESRYGTKVSADTDSREPEFTGSPSRASLFALDLLHLDSQDCGRDSLARRKDEVMRLLRRGLQE